LPPLKRGRGKSCVSAEEGGKRRRTAIRAVSSAPWASDVGRGDAERQGLEWTARPRMLHSGDSDSMASRPVSRSLRCQRRRRGAARPEDLAIDPNVLCRHPGSRCHPLPRDWTIGCPPGGKLAHAIPPPDIWRWFSHQTMSRKLVDRIWRDHFADYPVMYQGFPIIGLAPLRGIPPMPTCPRERTLSCI
jgi:hypothetical protein